MASQIQPKNKENENLGKQNRIPFIKKVILENFLSFQKDEVDFGEAKFVIIVGPNWSGKTSIFQAIKFALGSNERDNRYTKWSNFIRNSQNHAMVEIHIQNGDDIIQLRRYVIRGQSPFFKIKGKNEKEFHKVQAHDIQKVITDLNINPDNQFAFVSQGKIDAIKSLKPTELCSFLEKTLSIEKSGLKKLNFYFFRNCIIFFVEKVIFHQQEFLNIIFYCFVTCKKNSENNFTIKNNRRKDLKHV